ncbi:hypothetical protein HG530_004402 [Fusarium avenaceum]|nr:hypothetical protein HG530_004402 [Fusarium avenaceum]
MSVTLHTSHGDIKVEIYCESVPKTAENFLALCGSGYYDQSPFHRVIPKFMAQTGAPATPNPPENPKGGRSIWGGAFEDEIRPALRHGARGVLSMANKGPGTNGSQFFVTFDKAPHLDGLNTVFGRVIGDEGMATLAKMEGVEIDRKNRPKEPVRIENHLNLGLLWDVTGNVLILVGDIDRVDPSPLLDLLHELEQLKPVAGVKVSLPNSDHHAHYVAAPEQESSLTGTIGWKLHGSLSWNPPRGDYVVEKLPSLGTIVEEWSVYDLLTGLLNLLGLFFLVSKAAKGLSILTFIVTVRRGVNLTVEDFQCVCPVLEHLSVDLLCLISRTPRNEKLQVFQSVPWRVGRIRSDRLVGRRRCRTGGIDLVRTVGDGPLAILLTGFLAHAGYLVSTWLWKEFIIPLLQRLDVELKNTTLGTSFIPKRNADFEPARRGL